jgi:hypothetical protein
MGSEVSGDAYGRFMGRFSEPQADEFVALAQPTPDSVPSTSVVGRVR